MAKVFERILVAAAETDNFFDLSSDEQIRRMVEMAYDAGKADVQVSPAPFAGPATLSVAQSEMQADSHPRLFG